jgi:hypothetical protein
VRDLMALGASCVSNALASPHLYRVMFDAEVDLEDPAAAAETFHVLVSCAARARQSGRFAVTCDPEAVATRFWAMGHGVTMLVLTAALPRALDVHVPAMATALSVSAGDDPDDCRRSARSGWRTFDPPAPLWWAWPTPSSAR